jgi:hypothetical protein
MKWKFMACPECLSGDWHVLEVRAAPQSIDITRRRMECKCGHRFTVYAKPSGHITEKPPPKDNGFRIQPGFQRPPPRTEPHPVWII